MKRVWGLVLGVGFGLVAVSACGLAPVGDATVPDETNRADAGGSNPTDANTPPPKDASDDPTVDAAPPDTTCTTSSPPCAPPAGWEAVALPIGDGSDCPDGYTPLDVTEGSLVNPQQACDCTPVASPTDPPRCDKQDNYKLVGGTDLPVTSCLLGVLTANVNVDGSGCVPVPGAVQWTDLKATAIPPRPGTCTPECTADESHLVKTTTRVCIPTAECRDGACRGASANARADGFAYCFMKEGDDAECPGDAEKSVRRTVGGGASMTCTGGTCKNDAKCNNPTLQLFTDATCANPTYGSATVDNKCNRLPSQGLAAIQYGATLSSTPVMDTAPTASVTYAQPKTLCCPKAN